MVKLNYRDCLYKCRSQEEESLPAPCNTILNYNICISPQGFGVAAKATAECRHADPMDIICFHQADIGEYVRNEEALI